MPVQVPEESLSRAIFRSVTDGSYPDDERLVTADLRSEAVQSLSELLEQAREEVKVSIRELSRLSASDIDGWITQARHLKDDIDGSESQAAEIVSLAGKGNELDVTARDATEKVALLRKEVAFNQTLSTTLEQVQEVKQTVNVAQDVVTAGNLAEGVNLLKASRKQLSSLQRCDNTRLTGLLEAKLMDLEATLTESATKYWMSLVRIDADEYQITFERHHEGVSLETTVFVLDGLDLLKANIIGLKQAFESTILFPRLRVHPNSRTVSFITNASQISVVDKSIMLSTQTLFDDLELMINFLESVLPKQVLQSLSGLLAPSMISRLISGPLSSCVPPDLSGLIGFESSLSRVGTFARFLDSRQWPGSLELLNWVKNSSDVWLARRSDSSLDSVRQLLLRGLGKSRSVERVETQKVNQDDDVFQSQGYNDDWDASWSDGEDEAPKTATTVSEEADPSEQDDDDGDAWGWDDNENEHTSNHESTGPKSTADEDAGDAWGWGDDDGQKIDSPTALRSAQKIPSPKAHHNGKPTIKKPAQREVTLRESYFISALPEHILEIIVQVIDDADSLARADSSSSRITPASKGLLSLPTLILSMYRASAPTFYFRDANGNMYIYNDSLYLAEQLRMFAEHHQARSTGNDGLSSTGLESEIDCLELFGKRAYRKEMESQRTILGDMLDIAQEFRNCTEHPFSEQCDNAISSTIDRLREIHAQFKQVLSPSALLQSIGSLLSTITNKLIVNIEDMSDISEPESQRLASYCRRIAELENLFLPDQPEGAEASQPAVAAAVYISSWWKFQYLAEVLESSLADIKYLWTEGELSLEFEVGEVIDLIEALFTDSDHRRKAIAEIRRGARK